MRKACPVCGKVQPCPTHPTYNTGTRNPRRDLTQHIRWARAIKRRDGNQCQRCGSTDRLEAHHLNGVGSPAGVTLCHDCHAQVDQYVR